MNGAPQSLRVLSCEEFRTGVDLYVDGELADLERGELDSHAATCPACGELLARSLEIKARLHRLSSCTCPMELRSRIADALSTTEIGGEPAGRRLPRNLPRFALAAAAVVGVSTSVAFVAMGDESRGEPGEVAGVAGASSPIVKASVAWHRRNVPVEVTGPSASNVRGWFDDKLGFPVRIPEFPQQANLLGGRLGNIRQTEAAFVVYDVGGSKLSVMVFDPDNLGDPSLTSLVEPGAVFVDNSNGYNVAIHERDGLAYTFTSELPERRLLELVDHAFADPAN